MSSGREIVINSVTISESIRSWFEHRIQQITRILKKLPLELQWLHKNYLFCLWNINTIHWYPIMINIENRKATVARVVTMTVIGIIGVLIVTITAIRKVGVQVVRVAAITRVGVSVVNITAIIRIGV